MAANIQDKIPFGVVINLVTNAIANAPHDAIFHLSLPVGPAALLRSIALNSAPSAS